MSSPISPSHYDWTELYPILNHVNCPQILSPKSNPEHLPPLTSQVRFLDIGCGYGGLLMSLGPLFPQTLMLGMEIRKKVSDFVHEKVLALRQDGSLVEARDENQTLLEKKATDLVKLQTQKVHSNSTSFSSPNNTSATSQLTPSNPSSLTYSNIESSVEHSGCLPIEKSPHHFQNIAVMRMNAMKFLPNYFEKGQVTENSCNPLPSHLHFSPLLSLALYYTRLILSPIPCCFPSYFSRFFSHTCSLLSLAYQIIFSLP